jgi:hypothetical protein
MLRGPVEDRDLVGRRRLLALVGAVACWSAAANRRADIVAAVDTSPAGFPRSSLWAEPFAYRPVEAPHGVADFCFLFPPPDQRPIANTERGGPKKAVETMGYKIRTNFAES